MTRTISEHEVPGCEGYKTQFAWHYFEPRGGDEISQKYPFTKMEGPCWSDWDKGEVMRWRPGVWGAAFNGYDDFYQVAHGMGLRVIRVVHVVKLPAPYPRRVFYTRQFTDPSGREFKKSGLIIHSLAKFRSVCMGISPANYEIDADADPVPDQNAPQSVSLSNLEAAE